MAAIPFAARLSRRLQIADPISKTPDKIAGTISIMAFSPAATVFPSPAITFQTMDFMPCHALSQSPENTPPIKSVIPLKIPMIFFTTGASSSTARSKPLKSAVPSFSSSGPANAHTLLASSAIDPPRVCSWPHRTMTVSRNFSLLFHSRTKPAATAAITPAIMASFTPPMPNTAFSIFPPPDAALNMVDRFFTAPTAAVATCSALKAPTAVIAALATASIAVLFSPIHFTAFSAVGMIVLST